jgi:hypothetical protein
MGRSLNGCPDWGFPNHGSIHPPVVAIGRVASSAVFRLAKSLLRLALSTHPSIAKHFSEKAEAAFCFMDLAAFHR